MSIIKILRNVSGSTRNVLNQELADGESYQPPYGQWFKLADHQPTLDDIVAGYVVVNNGVVDLSVTDALKLIKRFDEQDAGESPFDNSTNGFSATNVQDAIEEAAGTAVSAPCLREVTFVLLGGTIPINTESNLLFEPDPTNNLIKFYREETL